MQQELDLPLIEIDPHSGFCFGVVRAIKLAEEHLASNGALLCLGDIVHNGEEVQRLNALGLNTIQHTELSKFSNAPILFRAHGEPPPTYQLASKQHLTIIDATCPVVLQLQRKVKMRGEQLKRINGQIVIFGKSDHAEVNGLLGQTDCTRYVVQTPDDLEGIDFTRPIDCFSQTTMSPTAYEALVQAIRDLMVEALHTREVPLTVHRTICGQVANRREQIATFARAHEVVLFVSGRKSSNGRVLYQECSAVNPRTYFISQPEEIEVNWLQGAATIGISGATSTPQWLMEKTAARVRELLTPFAAQP